ncbi:DNA invertase Pin-like site-specific DNA recombinase [Haloactinopolyspora alba]|uniref:DNA invertase Pin-like site-specific DNA recombinase n=1 Tax=Haloactinopolyspora alba TaxID=648780 RepID=A0A2P8DEZ0_9ACTN|nr:recombinase family protein [Haloactinopolyspora alba]PSK95757.1 DNA invertase Pin-like site-specific DNA recombinase [Haloactinopolyspora alba]
MDPSPTGHLIGYARVSTRDQNLDRQTDALEAAGCSRIFTDKASGKLASRPELDKALDYLRPGDTLVVPSLDRLARSLKHLVLQVDDLRQREVGFKSLHESIDTTTPSGRLTFHVFAALAEFVRELIVEGTHEGLAAARERGRTGGRPSVITEDKLLAAQRLLSEGKSMTAVAKAVGVSRPTLYRHLESLDLPEVDAPGALTPAE